MRENVHHVRTFELCTEWKELRKQFDSWGLAGYDMSEASKMFRRRYLPSALGKELNINETKGVKCVRISYDDNSEAIWLTAYDKSGYIDLELNLEYEKAEEKTQERKENDTSVKEESDSEFYTHHVFQDILFDACGAIARTPSDSPEVVVQANLQAMYFKKIPVCKYDIYMKDPFWLYYNIMGIERRFYDLGYKLTEVTRKYCDGIIDSSRHMYYDRKGVFLRSVFMCGTPWGSALVYDEKIWDYDYRDNTATVKEISTCKNVVRGLRTYNMDDQGRLQEQKIFLYPGRDKPSASKDEPTKKPVHSTTVHYAYGKNGRFCEIKTVLFHGEPTSGRKSYEYDAQGRLIAQRDYDNEDELMWEETYRYISDTKVEVTSRMHKRLLTPSY